MRLLSARDGNRVSSLRARPPAGGDPDGHQPAGYQWHRSPENPEGRPRNGAHSGGGPQCQRHAGAISRGAWRRIFRYLTKPIKVNEFMQTLDVTLEFARQGPVMPNKPERGSWSAQRHLNARIPGGGRSAKPCPSASRACCASPAIDPSSATTRPRTRSANFTAEPLLPDRSRSPTMPGMDGFQVMEGLKEIEEDGYLPSLGDHRATGLTSCAPSRPAPRISSASHSTWPSCCARAFTTFWKCACYTWNRRTTVKCWRRRSGNSEASREVIRLKTSGGAKGDRAGIGLGAGNSGKPAAPFPAPVPGLSHPRL